MRLNDFILNEDARTDFLETASCIGIICSDSDAKKAGDILNNFKEVAGSDVEAVLNNLVKYLDKSYDWNPSGKSQIQNLDFTQIDQVVDVFALVVGMNDFMKSVGRKIVGSKPQFIHNKINDYYKVEKQVLGEIPGSKANTADCIISNASAEKTLSAFSKGTVQPDSKLEYITLDGGIKIIQVSLKKSEKGAQLGKITSFLKKNLNFGDDTGVAVKSLTEDEIKEIVLDTGLITEGIWDKLKTMAGDLWNKVSSAVKSVMGKFTGKWMKVFKSKTPPDNYVRDFFNEVGVVTEGKINAPTQQVIDTISQNPAKAINAVNALIKRLDAASTADQTVAADISYLKPINKFSSKPSTAAFTLISNYLTARTLVDMIDGQKKVSEVVNRLVAEMLFGGTKLPLWKVYGNYGKGHSFTYLGTLDTFLKENKPKPKIEILGIRTTPQKDFYTITVFMLEGVYNEGRKYFVLRTGTNSSSRITFIFEGTAVRGPYPMDRNLKQILKGEK